MFPSLRFIQLAMCDFYHARSLLKRVLATYMTVIWHSLSLSSGATNLPHPTYYIDSTYIQKKCLAFSLTSISDDSFYSILGWWACTLHTVIRNAWTSVWDVGVVDWVGRWETMHSFISMVRELFRCGLKLNLNHFSFVDCSHAFSAFSYTENESKMREQKNSTWKIELACHRIWMQHLSQ